MQLPTLHYSRNRVILWECAVCLSVCVFWVRVRSTAAVPYVSGIKQNLIIIVHVQPDIVALLSGGGQLFDVRDTLVYNTVEQQHVLVCICVVEFNFALLMLFVKNDA